MSLSTATRAIDFALERDPSGLELSFFGGEPLLHQSLIEQATDFAERRLAATSAHAALVVHVNTNATMVDSRVQDFVRRCRSIHAFVSIDGPAEVHDKHRMDVAGRGTHAEVKRGIARLLEAGAEVIPLAVVNPDTARQMGAVAEELCRLPVARATVTCNLRAAWNEEALAAFRIGLREAMAVWAQAFRAGRIIQFEPFTTKILSHLHAAMPCAARCQLGTRELVVAPSGRIYPCGELVGEDEDDTHVIGTLDSGLALDRLQSLRRDKVRIESSCADCEIRDRCSSSCGCKHVALTGRFGAITNTLCDIEVAFIEAADQVAEELYRENCSAFLKLFYQTAWTVNAPAEFVQLRRKLD